MVRKGVEMMTFNLKPDICCCCAICGKEFDDGDLLCLRKTSLVCYSCCPDASEPTHVYSCGTGHRLLRSSTMTSLSNGFPGRRELKTLKLQQITLVTDCHSQMYGFLSSRAFQSSIFTRTFVKNRNLHFIAQNEIQKRFDLTP